eukprot:Nitzschia sp. Nitz4//scaffold73_size107353//62684//65689//NITZ4_004323-RA/size107353-processed-gene-0.193-mRNA-1//-1//CDS//3329557485//6643//frame0
MTPEQVEHYVVMAADPSDVAMQQQANTLLTRWVSSTSDPVLADALLPILRQSQQQVVVFFALTTIEKLNQTSVEQRATLRQALLHRIVQETDTPLWAPTFLRTKVGVLLASWVQQDFDATWPSAFDDLQQLESRVPDILLRTMIALMDDFGHHETATNTQIKDTLRGLQTSKGAPPIPPEQTISAPLFRTILTILVRSMEECKTKTPTEQDASLQLCILALTTIRGFMSWMDLSLLLQPDAALPWIFAILAAGSRTDSPMADGAVVAVECLQELIARGMEQDKKLDILVGTRVLESIHTNVNLETVDASPIDVVLEVAKFINRTGLEVLPLLTDVKMGNGTQAPARSQLLDLFFRCLAYDDIDVSAAVIPLAGALIPSKKANVTADNTQLLSQLLSVTYTQMKYPEDYQFDYEDEDEAEEEMYRTELRKLNQKLTRAAPDLCLQFICQALSQLPMPLSSAPTMQVEAALRLVYHYCEGILPAPGLKVVMANETFCNLLVALHTSDIAHHNHPEVLTLYLETAVRYYPLLKERPELLQTILEALSGSHGLQHKHPRVRSRACYLLLRLVKSLGSHRTNNKNNNLLRPYVETAVAGIQGLLENQSVELRTEDTLNLFETIGLLIGKTGLEPLEQQRYLTQVMTLHVRSIAQVLEREDAIRDDPQVHGDILANSISAIAHLSKGFKKPEEPVQRVLLEALQITSAVVERLPSVESVRNKTMVLLQRLILCLESKILTAVPSLLYLLTTNCTEADILDVAQLFNQICIQFKEESVPVLEASLLPFLQKCHWLAYNNSSSSNTTNTQQQVQQQQQPGLQMTAPHEETEQLSIQKLSYMVLSHIAMNQATGVLLTPTVVPHLESVLQSMRQGLLVDDYSVQRTCLMFFHHLLNKWMGQLDANSSVRTGTIQLVCTIALEQLTILQNSPGPIQDANQYRVVLELGAVLAVLAEHAPDLYHAQIVREILAHRLACPSNIVETFARAKDKESMEASLKLLMEAKATTTTA